jgi:hypothetical protein
MPPVHRGERRPAGRYARRVAIQYRRAPGPVHAAREVDGGAMVTVCGLWLSPRRRLAYSADATAVSCNRCQRGLASLVACVVVPFPGHTLPDLPPPEVLQITLDLQQLARRTYRIIRKLRSR